MKKILLLLVLAVLGVGGYLYYRSLTTGPEYSLMQAAKATQDHDMAAFERYVDVEQVTGSLVDQVTAQSSVLGMLNPGSFAFKGALRLLKPQLAKAAHKEIRNYVESGSLEAAAAAQPERTVKVSLAGLASKVVSTESKFKDIKYVNEQGEQALVGIEITQPKYDTTMVIEVKMQDKGDYWQVKEITNTGELLKHVARLEKDRLLKSK